MSNEKQTEMFQNYKPLYLVGNNEAGDQVLITFRYKEANSIPVLQLVHNCMDLDGKITTSYSDVQVEHYTNYIEGGIPSAFGWVRGFPIFTFNRKSMQLRFDFNDVPMSCVVMQDTAIPFVQLIARM